MKLARFLGTAAVVAAGWTAPAMAASGPPIGRVYGCYAYANGLQYGGSFALDSRTTYSTAADQTGRPAHLRGREGHGRMSISGAHLHFLTGTYAGWYGVWVPKKANSAARINFTKSDYTTWRGISCYLS